MPKESLKDKLEGKTLDLSMSEMSVVPVKEIAALPKATEIDLSCNQITVLPELFCNLTHIVKLDLSTNKLTALPDDFGSLSKLQHLDLLGNQLEVLPVSFCHLRSLRWLDLKDNPLKEELRKVAGDCLNDSQCKVCAHRVVAYMKDVQSEQERRKQKKLKEEREREAVRKAEEEAERKKKKAEKQAERERRRKQLEAEKALRAQQKEEEKSQTHKEEKLQNGIQPKPQLKEKAGIGCCGVLLSMLIGVMAVVIGLCIYCKTQEKDAFCLQSRHQVDDLLRTAQKYISQYMK